MGDRGNYSDRVCELVDRLQKRLVLSGLLIMLFRGAKRRGIWVLPATRSTQIPRFARDDKRGPCQERPYLGGCNPLQPGEENFPPRPKDSSLGLSYVPPFS